MKSQNCNTVGIMKMCCYNSHCWSSAILRPKLFKRDSQGRWGVGLASVKVLLWDRQYHGEHLLQITQTGWRKSSWSLLTTQRNLQLALDPSIVKRESVIWNEFSRSPPNWLGAAALVLWGEADLTAAPQHLQGSYQEDWMRLFWLWEDD